MVLARSIVLVATCVLVTCSSRTAPPPPTAQATIYTDASCRRLDRCQALQVHENFGDVDGCIRGTLPDNDDELRSAGTAVTVDQANACAGAMASAACDVLTSALPECQFAGTLDDGAPCGSGYQCKSSSCFRTTEDGVLALCGKCSSRVAENGNCTNANCAPGLLCAGGRCKVPAASGAACDDLSQPCRPSLQCVRGKCEPPLAEGAPCTPLTDTLDVIPCDMTKLLSCIQGKCTVVRFAAVGQACGDDVACGGASCSGGKCVGDLAEGAACDSPDAVCQVPLACIGGHCGRSSIASCK